MVDVPEEWGNFSSQIMIHHALILKLGFKQDFVINSRARRFWKPLFTCIWKSLWSLDPFLLRLFLLFWSRRFFCRGLFFMRRCSWSLHIPWCCFSQKIFLYSRMIILVGHHKGWISKHILVPTDIFVWSIIQDKFAHIQMTICGSMMKWKLSSTISQISSEKFLCHHEFVDFNMTISSSKMIWCF